MVGGRGVCAVVGSEVLRDMQRYMSVVNGSGQQCRRR
jgi:hypothetical protein